MNASGRSDKKRLFRSDLLASFSTALEGVVHTLRSERNMRIHFVFAFLVLILGIYLKITRLEFVVLCFAVSFVLVSEMFNTAIEYTVDLINDEYHHLAKMIKDIAAGAVFVSTLNAILAGYLIFVKRIDLLTEGMIFKLKQTSWNASLIALLVVVGIVLFVKLLLKEKNLLRGGMPSGHTSVAFAIWMMITLLTANPLVCSLVLVLAVLIARSRVTNGVHSIWEVLAGAFLGALLALLIYSILL